MLSCPIILDKTENTTRILPKIRNNNQDDMYELAFQELKSVSSLIFMHKNQFVIVQELSIVVHRSTTFQEEFFQHYLQRLEDLSTHYPSLH